MQVNFPPRTSGPMQALKAVSVIVATTPKGGIGKDGGLVWRLPEDMAYFKKVTTAGDKDFKDASIDNKATIS